ncbi:MAG TPA: beta-ketoacyl-[acyl-carrier-protein] synthase family protein [Bacteroidales bacterium]|nr:beta-ketoacyl-[acyl-carrier-protein] synthase family protein [Bacteroidales bacterium]
MGVVVTGVGIVSALGVGVQSNIVSMREGRSGISAHPSILKTGNILPVGELRMTNDELHRLADIPVHKHLSRTALLGIIAAREALADAKAELSKRIGLVSSTSVGGMDLTEGFFREFMKDDSAGRLRDVRMHDCGAITSAMAHYCGINAYTTTISTACSSAANAVMFGAKLIEHDVVDYVVAGGSDALSAFTLNGFKSLMILDRQACRPFDRSRAGLNLGEGAGYLVLQGDKNSAPNYYCRLAGYANRNDAHHQTATSAEGEGAFLAMAEALKLANLSPREVSYINAHGTGTQNNDSAESAAFIRLFGENIPAFSSTKGFTGHTLAAAGGIEAAYSVLSVAKGFLYPNLNFSHPIEEFGLIPNSEFSEGKDIDCVLSNSFGFGGNCSSLVFVR